MTRIDGFLAWADRRNIISVRAATLYATLWMTWDAFRWAGEYAFHTGLDGLGAAAVIAAVTAPISALQGFVFREYMRDKRS